MSAFSAAATAPAAYVAPSAAAPLPAVILVGVDLACSYAIDAAALILVGADLVCDYSISSAVPAQAGDIDANKVTSARTVLFAGGIRTVRF